MVSGSRDEKEALGSAMSADTDRPTTISVDALAIELAELAKRGGVQPGRRVVRIGPSLRAVCGISDDDPADRAHRTVAKYLSRRINPMPEVPRLLLLGVFGLVPEARLPLLTDRIAWIAEQFDRSPRTIQRRIPPAIELLAEVIVDHHRRHHRGGTDRSAGPAAPTSRSPRDADRSLRAEDLVDELHQLRKGGGLTPGRRSRVVIGPTLRRFCGITRDSVSDDATGGIAAAPMEITHVGWRLRNLIGHLDEARRIYALMPLGLDERALQPTLTRREEWLAQHLGESVRTVRRRADEALILLSMLAERWPTWVDELREYIGHDVNLTVSTMNKAGAEGVRLRTWPCRVTGVAEDVDRRRGHVLIVSAGREQVTVPVDQIRRITSRASGSGAPA